MSDMRDRGLDDLDTIVSELQATRLVPEPVEGDTPALAEWLRRCASSTEAICCSSQACRPCTGQGQVSRLPGNVLDGDAIERAVSPVVPSRLRERYREGEAIDLAFTLRGLGRFRMNLHRERGHAAAAIRALPTRIPRLSDCISHDVALLAELPADWYWSVDLLLRQTTTLAALVAEINLRHSRHIVTVEDPIEYEHPHGRSVIEQVEIGIDHRTSQRLSAPRCVRRRT